MKTTIIPERKMWQPDKFDHLGHDPNFELIQRDNQEFFVRVQRIYYEEDARTGRARCLICHRPTDEHAVFVNLVVPFCGNCLKCGNQIALPLATILAENAGIEFTRVTDAEITELIAEQAVATPAAPRRRPPPARTTMTATIGVMNDATETTTHTKEN